MRFASDRKHIPLGTDKPFEINPFIRYADKVFIHKGLSPLRAPACFIDRLVPINTFAIISRIGLYLGKHIWLIALDLYEAAHLGISLAFWFSILSQQSTIPR
jgi:hypothetical protein